MKKLILPLLFVLAFGVPQATQACTVPVFRFALERWELTTYEILVYHRGPLPDDVKAAVKHWTAVPAKANVEITVIDLDSDAKVAPAHQKLWKEHGNKDAAVWMLVPALANEVAKPIAWSGPCTPATLEAVMRSPMRQAILAHLSRGASVVYVLLTSDDAKADEQVHAMLTKKLANLEKAIKLPAQGDDPNSKLRLPLALKVTLPLLVLDRKDPQEAELISMLLATEDDLDEAKGPIVFPIFGRGRVLGSLYQAKKQTAFPAEQIDEATMFLCKECSCMVKELNPGTDMLLAANWGHIIDEMFEGKQAVPMPTAVSAALPQRYAPAITEVAPTPLGYTPPAPSPTIEACVPTPEGCCHTTCPGLLIAAGAAGMLVLVTGGWAAYRMWK